MEIEPIFDLDLPRTINDFTFVELANLAELGDKEALRIFNERLAKEMLAQKIRHLPGKHDQLSHGRGGGSGLARAGMGDIPISNDMAADMTKGSGGAYLQKNDKGNWEFTPERQALHDKIVQDSVNGVPRSDDPTVFMMGGGSASGKSRLRDSGKVDVPKSKSGKAVDIDPDQYKKALPEYAATNEFDRAPFTHEESSYLSKRVTSAAMERKQDIVLDGVANSGAAKVQSKIDVAHANGYKVVANYVSRPTALALEGNLARGAKEGRYVATSELKKLHIGVSQTVPLVAKNFDSFNLFDTTNFDDIKLVATGGKGKLDIVDAGLYSNFLAKANEKVF